jgi:NADPH:quinone reductase-like Zn-dependent oxidoreductase
VVVRIAACGLNRLDLWAEEAGLPVPVSLPRTLGGEAAGTVDALGDGVSAWAVGDRVALQSNLTCGRCEYCVAGEDSMCLEGRLLGIQCDGGFAEKCVVPAQALVRLPEVVSAVDSAALTLAGSTAMHMLNHRVQVRAGQTVLVIAGNSGVGSAGIQVARGLGARVVATASSAEKREFCRSLGADEVVDSSAEDWPAQVRRWTEKRGVDVVLEHVGGRVLEQVFHCLARGGTVVTCGATAGREVSMNLWPFFVKQHRLIGSYGRNRADLEATLVWAAAGRLKAAVESTVPLAQGAEAFARLRDRAVRGKLVLVPD